MYIDKNETVGTIVSRNHEAASIFNFYGIDFYCQGHRSFEQACFEDNVPMMNLMNELWDLDDISSGMHDFYNMDLTELSIYILNKHHKFAEKRVTFIKHTLERLEREHGGSKNHVARLKQIFDELSLYLTVHMKHEEFIIFPFIQKMLRTKNIEFSKLTGIEHPIAAMKEDHRHEVSTLKRLKTVTNSYAVPKDADYALKITYSAMRELEEDLKVHMHLENNILFPRAVSFATSLSTNLN
jgi:regulator of cell morphogenesis and NO signaling